MLKEKLFQFIWKYKLFDITNLKTIQGEDIQIVHTGNLNSNAGPDFCEAKIKLNKTLWAGNIELHVNRTDWKKHQHETNENYENIILHVVYKNDLAENNLNEKFSTLELSPYINVALLEKYNALMQHETTILCKNYLQHVKEITITEQLDRMLIERLENKTIYVKLLLEKCNNNWHDVFYISLAKSFGIHINQTVFENLALQTPLTIFAKHKNNVQQIEAILFGQAGFLADYFDESYPVLLQNEYIYLQKLHQLKPIEKKLWKFLRLRPANFPTVRIAQFAQLIHLSTHLFSKVIEANTIQEIKSLFDISVSFYWHTHYTFNEISENKNKQLGKTFIETIIINTVIPILFLYGKNQGKEEYCERAFTFLKQLKPEKNKIIDEWKSNSIAIKSAYETQALLELTNNYCMHKRCLECSIGYSILRK